VTQVGGQKQAFVALRRSASVTWRDPRRDPPSRGPPRRWAHRDCCPPEFRPAMVPIMAQREQPWLMRTYAGHSNPHAANQLYRTHLAKGQTGLSVSFDLPTQTGYDSDDPMATGEVGKVGVPISHIADMETLFAGSPLAKMNTSMTINATAAWLPALYVAAAKRQGAEAKDLRG